jgi:hypothetical protein
MTDDAPTPLLEVLVHDTTLDPTLAALCAGYELGDWRAAQLADHLFEWLPEFALTFTERQRFADTTAVRLIKRAAHVVYATDKYQRRGEFGELLLHAVVRQVFNSKPAISKLFYKDSANDTVKGFDAVHVVPTEDRLELWLGEVKFYEDARRAVRDVVEELNAHTDKDYLRAEFALIINKIDDAWPYADRLKRLLDPTTSLDEVFDCLRVPVLLTYDSTVVSGHTSWADPYRTLFEEEVRGVATDFAAKDLPNVSIHLLLVPLKQKRALVEALQQKLTAWQNI